MTYTTIQQGDREMYQCDECGIIGSHRETIEKGFCHQRHSEAHRIGDFKTSEVKKKEQKYRIKGISVKQFNDLME